MFLTQCAAGKKTIVKEKKAAVKNTQPVNNPDKTVSKQKNQETKKTQKTKEADKKEFIVTKELYTKTFEEIEETIKRLNKIIKDKDYESWESYLTQDYINKRSDPSFLDKMSSRSILKQNGIKLETLKDYFYYVVVPSRASARLDKIEMIDEKHVKAITIVNNTPIILYWLVKESGQWKIGVR